MITYLALVFAAVLIATIFYGFGIVMRRAPGIEVLQQETCTLCRRRFAKEELVERGVGDSKLLYFCRECIDNLHSDVTKRNGGASKEVWKS